MRRALAWAVVLAGCAGRSSVTVTVDASGTVGGVDRFHVTVTNAGQTATADFPLPGRPAMLPPPQSFGLTLPPDRSGKTTIQVDALAAAGATLASATGDVTVTPGEAATLALTLPGAAPPDGGAADACASCPILMASNLPHINAMVVDKSGLYATDTIDGTVLRIDLDGGGTTTLAKSQPHPEGLTSDGASVYWANLGTAAANYGDGTINAVPVGGGSVTVLAGQRQFPLAVAVHASTLYWTEQGASQSIYYYSTVDNKPHQFAGGLAGPHGLVAAMSGLAWTNETGGTVQYAAGYAGPFTTIGSGEATPTEMASNATGIFWIDTGPKASVGAGAIFAVSGNTQAHVLASQLQQPKRIAADAGRVYYTDDGTLFSLPAAGGTPSPLVAGQNPVALAVDAAWVYYAEWDAGTVYKVAK